MINTVFLAGYGNSKDGHWQKEWYKITNNSHWVEQPDWDNPDCNQWVASLDSLTFPSSSILYSKPFFFEVYLETEAGVISTSLRGLCLLKPLE